MGKIWTKSLVLSNAIFGARKLTSASSIQGCAFGEWGKECIDNKSCYKCASVRRRQGKRRGRVWDLTYGMRRARSVGGMLSATSTTADCLPCS